MHIHQSVTDMKSGRNLFCKADGTPSPEFFHFIGGMQHFVPKALVMMREIAAADPGHARAVYAAGILAENAGETDEAAASFDEAVRISAEQGARPFEGRALLARGRFRRGSAEGSADLEAALAIFEALGMDAYGAQARALLA